MNRSLTDAVDAVRETLLHAWWYLDSVKEGAVASMALPGSYEHLPRKYLCGVVPSIVRNISMKALTLS